MGQIIEDIKSLLWGRKEWKQQFVPREGNTVAHLLAKYAVERLNVIFSDIKREKICND